MKNRFRILVTAYLAVVAMACQQMPEDSPESRGTVSLKVKATTVETGEVNEWEEGISSDITMEGVQAKSRAGQEAVTRMAFVLINGEGEKVLAQESSSDEDDFAVLEAEIPAGDYTLIAFGHNGTVDAVINTNKTIDGSGEKLTDSFLYSQDLSLTQDTEEKSIVLNRCVAKVSIKHTDAIPSIAKTIELIVTGGGNVLDATTGLAVSTTAQKSVIQIPASAVGKKNNTFSLYTFLPSEECEVNATVVVKNADGEVISSQTVEDIPVEINMQTVCSGTLFDTSSSVTATVNSEWKQTTEISF